MNKEEYKKKVKELFINYLKTKGYPDKLSNEDIINHHLKPLYLLLEENNLKLEGLDYNKFVNIAHHMFIHTKLMSMV